MGMDKFQYGSEKNITQSQTMLFVGICHGSERMKRLKI